MYEPKTMPDKYQLTERDWRSLLRELHSGQVIPVVGPGLVTVDREGSPAIPLHQHLAPELASELQLDNPHRFN